MLLKEGEGGQKSGILIKDFFIFFLSKYIFILFPYKQKEDQSASTSKTKLHPQESAKSRNFWRDISFDKKNRQVLVPVFLKTKSKMFVPAILTSNKIVNKR